MLSMTSRALTVLVTGATAGIGEATAERFARDGARLVIAGRRIDRLEALAKRLGALAPIHPLPFDVRDRAAVERSLSSLPADFARVDVLVNNAGLALGLEPAHRASLDEWEEMIDTNNRGLVTVTRLLLPGMVERGRGHVVNVGSVAGTYPYPGGNVYGATKASFTSSLSTCARTWWAPGCASPAWSPGWPRPSSRWFASRTPRRRRRCTKE